MSDVLPEGIRCDLTVYLTSDSSGLEVALSVRNLPIVPKLERDPGIEGLKALHLSFGSVGELLGKDARIMTNAEVNDYLLRQREEDAL